MSKQLLFCDYIHYENQSNVILQLLMSGSSSRVDLSVLGRDEEPDMGLLWLLDQIAMTPGGTEAQFVEKLSRVHGATIEQCRYLVYMRFTATLVVADSVIIY